MTTLERIDNHPAGIVTTTRTDMTDPWKLGHWLASRPSDEQAALLHGLQTGLEEMGVVESSRQLDYVREIADLAGFDLRQLTVMLTEHLGGGNDD